MARKPKPVIMEPVPWTTISQADIDSLTTHRTNKYLPPLEDIPPEFIKGNIYTRIIEQWYVGEKGPPASYSFNPGFIQDGPKMKRFIMTHLSDFETDYEHKIAGVAYMLSKIFTIKEK